MDHPNPALAELMNRVSQLDLDTALGRYEMIVVRQDADLALLSQTISAQEWKSLNTLILEKRTIFASKNQFFAGRHP